LNSWVSILEALKAEEKWAAIRVLALYSTGF